MWYFVLVMSRTFTLVGRSSELELDVSPEIPLDRKYALALVGLYTYNSYPNIEKGRNDKFYYWKKGKNNKRQQHEVTIEEGAYEITDIERILRKSLREKPTKEGEQQQQHGEVISLKPNNNTLKCELRSKYDIDFTPEDSIGPLLGFSKTLLHANKLHSSDKPVDIVRVNLIRVECNLVFGSYLNSKKTHILFEFKPTVDPGYAINITPNHLIFQDVQENLGSIRHISVRLTDQKSELINFRGEEVIVRLELKPV